MVQNSFCFRKGSRRYAYFLLTKQNHSQKPKYEDFQELSRLCVTHEVKKLAFSQFGLLMDGFDWPKVRAMLKEVLLSTDLYIRIYTF